jgi:O-antigen/teichoic acid export membrane protein
MIGRVNFLRGVSSSWVLLLVVALVQLAQIRIGRDRFTQEEFVLFNVLSSLVGLFFIVELGIRSAFARLLLDAEMEGGVAVDRLWSSTNCVLALQAAAMLVLGALCLPFLPEWFNAPPALVPSVRWVFASLCLLTALGYAFGMHTVALMAHQRFVLVNSINIFSSLAGFALFYFAIQSGAGLWAAVAGAVPFFIGSSFIAPVASGRLLISRPLKLDHVSKAEVRSVFSLGLDLFWIGLYNLILGHTLLVFAGSMLPAAIAAGFSVNLKFAQLALQAAQRMPGTAEPILSRLVVRNEIVRFRDAWQLSAKAALLTTLLAAGGLYLWMGWTIERWTSKADVINGVPLLFLSLLPVRYITHTVFVLSATIFKAGREIRGPLVFELCIYSVMAYFFSSTMGLAGLLLANLVSLPFGSLFSGIRLLMRQGGFLRNVVTRIFSCLILPLASGLCILAWFCPQPELLSQTMRFGLTALWLLFGLGTGWFLCLSNSDRIRVSEFFRFRQSNLGV